MNTEGLTLNGKKYRMHKDAILDVWKIKGLDLYSAVEYEENYEEGFYYKLQGAEGTGQSQILVRS